MQFRKDLIRFFLIVGLCSTVIPAAAQQTKLTAAPTPASQTDSARRVETFEIVWKTINESFFDPKFGGVDWRAVHEHYAETIFTMKTIVNWMA